MRLELRVHQRLGTSDLGNPRKTVTGLLVSNPMGLQLFLQPMASIQTKRQRVRSPRLEADVAESHLRMIEVVVEENALAGKDGQFQSLGLAIGHNRRRYTWFNHAEHANRSIFGHAAFLGYLSGEGIFVHSTAA